MSKQVNVNDTQAAESSTGFGSRLGVDHSKETKKSPLQKEGRGYELDGHRTVIDGAIFEEDEMYWGVTKTSRLLPKNQLRTNVSNVLRGLFKDYVGCNIFLNQQGTFDVVAFFGPSVVNPDGKYRAFDVKTEDTPQKPVMTPQDKAIAMLNLMNANKTIYRITKDGHGLLSDLVKVGWGEKDSNGWVKNIQKHYTEVTNTPMQWNGYMLSYYTQQNTNSVWCAVTLDIYQVLKFCFGHKVATVDQGHKWDYEITATGTMVYQTVISSYAQQEADFLVEIKEIDSVEMGDLANHIGIATGFANPALQGIY